MAEAFSVEIPKLLVSGDTLDVVKQSAALCLLRLFRTDPGVIPSGKSLSIYLFIYLLIRTLQLTNPW